MDTFATELLAGEQEYDHMGEEESTGTNSSDLYRPRVSSCAYSTENLMQTDPCSNGSPKKAGRKTTPATLILSALKTKNDKPLKKEYVRCQLIRGEKKLARQFKDEKYTRKSQFQFELTTPDDVYYWGQLKSVYQRNPQLFDELSSTASGPATDGIRKRVTEAEHKSFNDEFCRRHYSSEEAREFHYFYVLLAYGKEVTDPSVLCKKLGVQCCKSGCHTDACVTAWEKVRKLVLFDLVRELGLEPFTEGCSYEEQFEDVQMFGELEDPYSFLSEDFSN